MSFAHHLTIAARDTYEVGGTELVDGARMRRINEVQHRILAHAHALLIGRTERYPDHVLLAIVLDDGQPHAKGTIRQAFQETWKAFERDTSRQK